MTDNPTIKFGLGTMDGAFSVSDSAIEDIFKNSIAGDIRDELFRSCLSMSDTLHPFGYSLVSIPQW